MAPSKVALSFIAVLLSLLGLHHPTAVDGFLTSVPVRAGVRSRVGASKPSFNSIEPRPQQPMFKVLREQTFMSSSQRGNSPSSGIPSDEPTEPTSRLGRFSQRVKNVIRKAIMGYLPEEEKSYKEIKAERDAKKAALTASLRTEGETEVTNPHLLKDARIAKAAAAQIVNSPMTLPTEDYSDDDILSKDFVHLDIGDQSPKDAEEDMMASLRRRIENGLPPDTEAEKRQNILRQQQQQRASERKSSSRPASFDGDTAVAERSPNTESTQDPKLPQQGQSKAKEPKMASREDIERFNRMFGSMGGEPLP